MVSSFSIKETRQFNDKRTVFSTRMLAKTAKGVKYQDNIPKKEVGPLPHNTLKNQHKIDPRTYSYINVRTIVPQKKT